MLLRALVKSRSIFDHFWGVFIKSTEVQRSCGGYFQNNSQYKALVANNAMCKSDMYINFQTRAVAETLVASVLIARWGDSHIKRAGMLVVSLRG